MVRETRHLKVSNLSQDLTAQKLTDYFKRFGRIQKVELKNEVPLSAVVSFADITSSSKAMTEICHKIENKALNVSYYEPGSAATSAIIEIHESSISLSSATTSRTGTNNCPGRNFGVSHGDFDNSGAGCEREPTYSRSSTRECVENRNNTRRYRPGSTATTNYNGGGSSSRSYWHDESGVNGPSAQNNNRSSGYKTRQDRSVSSHGSSSTSRSQSPHHSEDSSRDRKNGSQRSVAGAERSKNDENYLSRPPALIVRNLPVRNTDHSIKDGLFHKYKKQGKVVSVKVIGEGEGRYALVTFRRHSDIEKIVAQAKDELFLGNEIRVSIAPPGMDTADDNEKKPLVKDYDEFHPQSSRTLYVGNLESRVTDSVLRDMFSSFGEILDIDVKNRETPAPFAFVQFADIVSVVKSIHNMDSSYLGSNRSKLLKLGFGKTLPTHAVWMEGVQCSQSSLAKKMNFYGTVTAVYVDPETEQAIVFYENIDAAQKAVNDMKTKQVVTRKIQVDYASRELQDVFVDRMDRTRDKVRPDRFSEGRDRDGRLFSGRVGGGYEVREQFYSHGNNMERIYSANGGRQRDVFFNCRGRGGRYSRNFAFQHSYRGGYGNCYSGDYNDGHMEPFERRRNNQGNHSAVRGRDLYQGRDRSISPSHPDSNNYVMGFRNRSPRNGRDRGLDMSSEHSHNKEDSRSRRSKSGSRQSPASTHRSSNRSHERRGRSSSSFEDQRSSDSKKRGASEQQDAAAADANAAWRTEKQRSSTHAAANHSLSSSTGSLDLPLSSSKGRSTATTNCNSSTNAVRTTRDPVTVNGSLSPPPHHITKPKKVAAEPSSSTYSTSIAHSPQQNSRSHRDDSSDESSSTSSDDEGSSTSSSSGSSSSAEDDRSSVSRSSASPAPPRSVVDFTAASSVLAHQLKNVTNSSLTISVAHTGGEFKSEEELQRLQKQRQELLNMLSHLEEPLVDISGVNNIEAKPSFPVLPFAVYDANKLAASGTPSGCNSFDIFAESPVKEEGKGSSSDAVTNLLRRKQRLQTVTGMPIPRSVSIAESVDSVDAGEHCPAPHVDQLSDYKTKDSASGSVSLDAKDRTSTGIKREPDSLSTDPENSGKSQQISAPSVLRKAESSETSSSFVAASHPATTASRSHKVPVIPLEIVNASDRPVDRRKPLGERIDTVIDLSVPRFGLGKGGKQAAAAKPRPIDLTLQEKKPVTVSAASVSARRHSSALPSPLSGALSPPVDNALARKFSDPETVSSGDHGDVPTPSSLLNCSESSDVGSPGLTNLISSNADLFTNHGSPSSPGGNARPSLEERIKALDEKFVILEQAVKAVKKEPASSKQGGSVCTVASAAVASCSNSTVTTTASTSYGAASAATIDITKYIKKKPLGATTGSASSVDQNMAQNEKLACLISQTKNAMKSSIFDQDIERLSAIEEKYTPGAYFRVDSLTTSALEATDTSTLLPSLSVPLTLNIPQVTSTSLSPPFAGSQTSCSSQRSTSLAVQPPLVTTPTALTSPAAPAHGILKKTSLTPSGSQPFVSALPTADPKSLVSPTTVTVPTPSDPRLAARSLKSPGVESKPVLPFPSAAAPQPSVLPSAQPLGAPRCLGSSTVSAATPIRPKQPLQHLPSDPRQQQRVPQSQTTTSGGTSQQLQRSHSVSSGSGHPEPSTPTSASVCKSPATGALATSFLYSTPASGFSKSFSGSSSEKEVAAQPQQSSYQTPYFTPPPKDRTEKTFGHSHIRTPTTAPPSKPAVESKPTQSGIQSKSLQPQKELKNQQLVDLFKSKDGDWQMKTTSKEKVNLPKIARKSVDLSSEPVAVTEKKEETSNKPKVEQRTEKESSDGTATSGQDKSGSSKPKDKTATVHSTSKEPKTDEDAAKRAKQKMERKRAESESVPHRSSVNKEKEKDKLKQLKPTSMDTKPPKEKDADKTLKLPSSKEKGDNATLKKTSDSSKKDKDVKTASKSASAAIPNKLQHRSGSSKKTADSESEEDDSDASSSDSVQPRAKSQLSKEWLEVLACLDEEPAGLSMYDRVKRRSSAMRPETQTAQDKFSKLKETRHLKLPSDGKKPRRVRLSDDEDDSGASSDNSDDSAHEKQSGLDETSSTSEAEDEPIGPKKKGKLQQLKSSDNDSATAATEKKSAKKIEEKERKRSVVSVGNSEKIREKERPKKTTTQEHEKKVKKVVEDVEEIFSSSEDEELRQVASKLQAEAKKASRNAGTGKGSELLEAKRKRGRPPGRKRQTSGSGEVSLSATPTSELSENKTSGACSVDGDTTAAAKSVKRRRVSDEKAEKRKLSKVVTKVDEKKEEVPETKHSVASKMSAAPASTNSTTMAKKEKHETEDHEEEQYISLVKKKRRKEEAKLSTSTDGDTATVDATSVSSPPAKKKKNTETEAHDKLSSKSSEKEKKTDAKTAVAGTSSSVPTKAAKKQVAEALSNSTSDASSGEFRLKTKAAMKMTSDSVTTIATNNTDVVTSRLNRQTAFDSDSDATPAEATVSAVQTTTPIITLKHAHLDAAELQSLSPDLVLALQQSTDDTQESNGPVEVSIAEVVVTDGNAIILPDSMAEAIMTSASCGSSDQQYPIVNDTSVSGVAVSAIETTSTAPPSAVGSKPEEKPMFSPTRFSIDEEAARRMSVDEVISSVAEEQPTGLDSSVLTLGSPKTANPSALHVDKVIDDVIHGYVEIEPQELMKLTQRQQHTSMAPPKKSPIRERNPSFTLHTPASAISSGSLIGHSESQVSKDSHVQAALPTSLQRSGAPITPVACTQSKTHADSATTFADAVSLSVGELHSIHHKPSTLSLNCELPVSQHEANPQLQQRHVPETPSVNQVHTPSFSNQQLYQQQPPLEGLLAQHQHQQIEYLRLQQQQQLQSVAPTMSSSSVPVQTSTAANNSVGPGFSSLNNVLQKHTVVQPATQGFTSTGSATTHVSCPSSTTPASSFPVSAPASSSHMPSSQVRLSNSSSQPQLQPGVTSNNNCWSITAPSSIAGTQAQSIPSTSQMMQTHVALPTALSQQQTSTVPAPVTAAAVALSNVAAVASSANSLYGGLDHNQVRALMQQQAALMAQQAAALRHPTLFEQERLLTERVLAEQQRQQQLRAASLAQQQQQSQQAAPPQPHQHATEQQNAPNQPVERSTFKYLIQRYPIVWQGHLALKNDQALVQMHYVSGNRNLPLLSLPAAEPPVTPVLRVAQRMRLEPQQLDGVARRMQLNEDHCLLLALPCGRDQMDIINQSSLLQTGFISYLQQKQAAGIVNVSHPIDQLQQPAYVVHIFPPCDFAKKNFVSVADDFHRSIQERNTPYLLIVIATVS